MFLLEFLVNHFYVSATLLMLSIVSINFLRREKKQAKANLKFAKAKAAGTDTPNTLHPVIDLAKCGGCGACTTVCPEGDILQMIDGKAVLINGSKCVGHGECQRACPLDAIDLVFGTLEKGIDIPNLSKDYETNMPNVYIAGELGGMGLIRNAIKQGSWAAYHAMKSLDSKTKTDTDLFIIGAGPAGMSAALAAIEKKVSYVLIDQNTFGGTVNNYPRNKIVMSYPADLPIVGKMKFSNNKVTKEDLLDFWSDAVKKAKVKIHNSTKFIKYKDEGKFFTIETDKRNWTAKKIILAMGSGGLPMKLGLKNEDSPKVFYTLKDPESYKKKHVVVVGGGNSAVEAAQYLGAKKLGNTVKLLVRGKALSRTNEDNVTIINRMQDEGLVEICYETSIKDIQPDKITIDTKGEQEVIPNDFIFVFAGNIKPYKQLAELGIKIETKFGEKIAK